MSEKPEAREQALAPGSPYLSHSRISRYLLCPEQYRLYYVENLRPRFPAAGLVFGQVVHHALANLFETGADPVAAFDEGWGGLKTAELAYSGRESWEKLRDTGRRLLEKFAAEEMRRVGAVSAVERPFRLDITSLDLPLVGIVDLVAQVDGTGTVVDFKTAGSSFKPHEVVLSDQLTAYQIAEPAADQVALCVLVKTKEPAIEWHLGRRGREDILEYLAKARLVAREVTAGRFYKRPGLWCSWCDFLPVCAKDEHQAKETLVTLG